MIWFITMIAGVLGLYAKGNQWVNAPREPDPVLTEVQSLSTRFSGVEETIKDIDARVSALEAKDDGVGRGDV